MENLARFVGLGVASARMGIHPCIKVATGIEIAARVAGAQFRIEMTILYTASGNVVVETANPLVREWRTIRALDSRSVLMDIDVPLSQRIDANTSVSATCQVTIQSASGDRVEVSDTEVFTLAL